MADPSHPPTGCYFHPRCCYAREVQKREMPELREVQPRRHVACHYAEQLSLRGVGGQARSQA